MDAARVFPVNGNVLVRVLPRPKSDRFVAIPDALEKRVNSLVFAEVLRSDCETVKVGKYVLIPHNYGSTIDAKAGLRIVSKDQIVGVLDMPRDEAKAVAEGYKWEALMD